jgi:hypothetical protein
MDLLHGNGSNSPPILHRVAIVGVITLAVAAMVVDVAAAASAVGVVMDV